MPDRIRKRHVLYVGGFDPRGSKHIHSLYKNECALQQQAGGLAVEVGRRARDANGNSAWSLDADLPEGPVEGRMTCLGWDDVVRAHWPQDTLRMWSDIVRTTAVNLHYRVLQRLLRASWPPALALMAPMLIALTLVFCVLVLVALGAAALDWWNMRGEWVCGGLVASLVGLGVGARALVRRFSMYWIARSYAFHTRLAQGKVPAWQHRVQEHARTLVAAVAALDGQKDAEVLLVGHSSGSILAVAILAEALRADPALAQRGPALSLLTLGQCIPLLGCFPQAHAFRRDLASLALADGLAWVDFSAPPDACCFALCNPLWACQVEVPGLPDRPKLLSPRFAEMFDAPAYEALRADRLKLHFQYLMASQHPVDYDYFRITAGNQTLAARYAPFPSIDDYIQFRFPKQ